MAFGRSFLFVVGVGFDLVICTPDPPSTWYIQISLEPIPNCAFETKMYLPSGAQPGEVNSLLGSFETCFTPVPSGCMLQMFSLPSRSERKAFFLCFLLVFLFFLFVLLLLRGILPFCAGVQRRCGSENEPEEYCQADKPRGQTTQTGLLHAHARFPPYLLSKTLNRNSRIGCPMPIGLSIYTRFSGR